MFDKKNSKSIARIVAVMFFWVVILAAWPPGTSAGERLENAPSASAGIATKATDDFGSFEKETAPAKKKKFPWLLAAAGAAAIGVVVYFLVIKKPSYKLTVEIASCVMGNPGSGVYTYKKGKNVYYYFSALQGYESLKVLLDGKEIPSSGAIRMDRDHVLKAAAQEITYTLKVSTGVGVKGTPAAGTFTYRWNESVAYGYSVDEVYQNLKVLLDGAEAKVQGTVTMDSNHTLSATAEVKPLPPSPCPPPSGIFDIRGKWILNLKADNYDGNFCAAKDMDLTFNGSISEGALEAILGAILCHGNYTVNGNTIDFQSDYSYKHHVTYWGTVQDQCSMSGRYHKTACDLPYCHEEDGTWIATRK